MSNSSHAPPRASLFSPQRLSWILTCIAAVGFAAYYSSHTFVLNEADPRLLAHFQGHKPYQLRVLLPLLLLVLERLGLSIERGCQLLILASALATAAAFRLYLSEFIPPKIARFAALALWPPLLLFYSHRWLYLYDMPSVAFLCLGLFFQHHQRWTAFAVLLALASLNRESSIMLVMVYAADSWAPRSGAFWGRFLAFTLIWAMVKAGLTLCFAANPGAGFERHWNDNGLFLTYPQLWSALFSCSLFLYLVLLTAALAFWRQLPRLLRVTTLLSALMPVIFFAVGVVYETRLLGETMPLLLPAVLFGGWKLSLQKKLEVVP